MQYSDTLGYLYSRLPMFHRIGAAAYKADLGNTLRLAEILGNPEQEFPVIHVAGTNGKGSVSHMMASILQESGLKTGLYTSPHLKDFRERIRVNGAMIPKRMVTAFVRRYSNAFDAVEPSFFEWTFALCLDYFRREKVDIAVMETGMGGRLDSTNICRPELCIITNIGLDHTAFLGDTLGAIASEKAGIIKKGIPVIIGESVAETKAVFEKRALQMQAPLYYAKNIVKVVPKGNTLSPGINVEAVYKDGRKAEFLSPLRGNYQLKNIATVLAACELYHRDIRPVRFEDIKTGIANTISNTGLRGRWEQLGSNPAIIADTGHNAEGIREVVRQLTALAYKHLHIVLGMVSDKDSGAILNLLPKDADYYFCKPDIPRGMEVSLLKEAARKAGLRGKGYSSVKEAFTNAKKTALSEDLIFIGGSTFVVAEVL